jgi:hypothetical protein
VSGGKLLGAPPHKTPTTRVGREGGVGRVKGWVCNACVGCVRHDSGVGAGEPLLKSGDFFSHTLYDKRNVLPLPCIESEEGPRPPHRVWVGVSVNLHK